MWGILDTSLMDLNRLHNSTPTLPFFKHCVQVWAKVHNQKSHSIFHMVLKAHRTSLYYRGDSEEKIFCILDISLSNSCCEVQVTRPHDTWLIAAGITLPNLTEPGIQGYSVLSVTLSKQNTFLKANNLTPDILRNAIIPPNLIGDCTLTLIQSGWSTMTCAVTSCFPNCSHKVMCRYGLQQPNSVQATVPLSFEVYSTRQVFLFKWEEGLEVNQCEKFSLSGTRLQGL